LWVRPGGNDARDKDKKDEQTHMATENLQTLVQVFTDSNFEETVIKAGQPVLVGRMVRPVQTSRADG
jgi:hypothetical protein